MMKVGKSDGEGTFAGTRGNDKVAPISDLPPSPRTEGSTFTRHFVVAQKIIELWVKRSSAPTAGSRQLAEQLPRIFEVGGGEALGEPAVDRSKQIAGCGATTLVSPQPGKARGGAQFPQPGFLHSGDAEGFAIQLLGGFGIALPEQQPASLPIELRGEPTLPRPLDELQRLVQPGR